MHHHGANISGTKLSWCTYENGQFDEHIIRDGVELFVDYDHACAVAYFHSISCILFNFLGVTVHWKVGK